MRKLVAILSVAFFVAVWTGSAFANGDGDYRLDKLQRQVSDLQKQIKDMKSGEAPSGEVTVSSKYNIKIYGKIKFDSIYDTNNMGRDEFITYIPKNADGEDRSTFNVRDTRLGVAITGPSLNGWDASGRFESDFYGR